MDINTETESLIWTWCYSFSAMWLSCFVLKRFAWNDPVEGRAAKPIFKLIGDLLFFPMLLYLCICFFGPILLHAPYPSNTSQVIGVTVFGCVGLGYGVYFRNFLPSPTTWEVKIGKVLSHIVFGVGLAQTLISVYYFSMGYIDPVATVRRVILLSIGALLMWVFYFYMRRKRLTK